MSIQALDLKDESERLKLAQFLEELRGVCDSSDAQPENSNTISLTMEELKEIPIEICNDTIHLPDPITSAALRDLVQFFVQGGVLHEKYLLMILHEAAELLSEAPAVTVLAAPSLSRKVTVVGDLHGSFRDLVLVLESIGEPGPSNQVIFNGDFVDRGPQGVEVLATLLALKLVHPESVHLNRGNHEDAQLVKVYDFYSEVRADPNPKSLTLPPEPYFPSRNSLTFTSWPYPPGAYPRSTHPVILLDSLILILTRFP